MVEPSVGAASADVLDDEAAEGARVEVVVVDLHELALAHAHVVARRLHQLVRRQRVEVAPVLVLAQRYQVPDHDGGAAHFIYLARDGNGHGHGAAK